LTWNQKNFAHEDLSLTYLQSIPNSPVPLRVCLVRELRGGGGGGEGRDFNEGERRGDILIKNVFGSRGEGRDFKITLLFYP